MIPNNTTYEAGFKTQFFTTILITGFLIFGVWSLTKLLINISQEEENQKRINKLIQKGLDILNYYLDDLKYVDDAIKFFRKNIRHREVYESVAVENGLLPPKVEEKPKTIYCAEYYQKVLEKQKANKELFSDVTIYLTLSSGITLNYIPKYPWYWDGVELFTGIQPNEGKIYDQRFLYPGYIPRINVINENIYYAKNNETQNVKTSQEAKWIGQSLSSSQQTYDEEKKLSTILLTKNNSLNVKTPSISPFILTINENNKTEISNNSIQNQHQNEGQTKNDDTSNDIIVPFEKEDKNLLVSISPESLLINLRENETKVENTKVSSNSKLKWKSQINSDIKIERHLKLSKSTSYLKNEKVGSLKDESNSSSTLRKSKSLPNFNNKSKNQQKQKYLKKLKHKKQPKIIYPSIPVNPNLSFVPLYKKNLNESKVKSRVKHSEMENTYKRLNCIKSLIKK
jgi:hypothetical protein